MKDNPVYLRLTQHSRQLPRSIEWLLPVAIGIAGGGAAAGAVYYWEASRGNLVSTVLVLALGLGGAVFSFAAPSFALVAVALFTAKDTPRESLTVLWLTNISAEQIADGYIEAVSHKLRILRVIGIGLAPQVVITLTYLAYGGIAAMLVTGMLLAIGDLMLQLSVAIGVWMGFRWGGRAPLAAGAIVLVVWTMLGLVAVVIRFLNEQDICCATVAAMVMVFFTIPFLRSLVQPARLSARRAVERMRPIQ